MNYAFDRRLGKWVVLWDGIVIALFETEYEAISYYLKKTGVVQ